METTRRGFLGSLVAVMATRSIQFEVKANPVIPCDSDLLFERILRLSQNGAADFNKFRIMPTSFIQDRKLTMMGCEFSKATQNLNIKMTLGDLSQHVISNDFHHILSFEEARYEAQAVQRVLGAHLIDDEGFIIGYHDYAKKYKGGIYMNSCDTIVMTYSIEDVEQRIKAINKGQKHNIPWNFGVIDYKTRCARVDVNKYVGMNA